MLIGRHVHVCLETARIQPVGTWALPFEHAPTLAAAVELAPTTSYDQSTLQQHHLHHQRPLRCM